MKMRRSHEANQISGHCYHLKSLKIMAGPIAMRPGTNTSVKK
jgi:hypothetical protein